MTTHTTYSDVERSRVGRKGKPHILASDSDSSDDLKAEDRSISKYNGSTQVISETLCFEFDHDDFQSAGSSKASDIELLERIKAAGEGVQNTNNMSKHTPEHSAKGKGKKSKVKESEFQDPKHDSKHPAVVDADVPEHTVSASIK